MTPIFSWSIHSGRTTSAHTTEPASRPRPRPDHLQARRDAGRSEAFQFQAFDQAQPVACLAHLFERGRDQSHRGSERQCPVMRITAMPSTTSSALIWAVLVIEVALCGTTGQTPGLGDRSCRCAFH
jgi:hypothetical protein